MRASVMPVALFACFVTFNTSLLPHRNITKVHGGNGFRMVVEIDAVVVRIRCNDHVWHAAVKPIVPLVAFAHVFK